MFESTIEPGKKTEQAKLVIIGTLTNLTTGEAAVLAIREDLIAYSNCEKNYMLIFLTIRRSSKTRNGGINSSKCFGCLGTGWQSNRLDTGCVSNWVIQSDQSDIISD